jgi:two-component system sensor histidine kinase/response regulator
MRQLLGKRGHRVHFARTGREALVLHGQQVFDAVLLDVRLPEMDGFSVIGAIRETERASGQRLPVIAVTARSRPEDREACLAAGMDAFLSKPISPARLWATLDEVVARRISRHPLIDVSVLLAACDEDAAVLDSIRSALRAALPVHVAALERACGDRDWSRLREGANHILGLVSVFSPRAGRIASDLVDCATRGGPETTLLGIVGSLAVVTPDLIRALDEASVTGLRAML